jgi:hypothetical protein
VRKRLRELVELWLRVELGFERRRRHDDDMLDARRVRHRLGHVSGLHDLQRLDVRVGLRQTSDGQTFTCAQFCDGSLCTSLQSYCDSLVNIAPITCGSSTCDADECCNCGGTDQCVTLVGAETCGSFSGCTAGP